MKKIALILGIGLLLIACNKNQRAANKLEGKWNVTGIFYADAGAAESTTNHLVEEDRTMTYDFKECKVKKDDDCACEWQTIDYTGYETNYTWLYTVDDKGETIRIGYDLNDPDPLEVQVWTINKLTKKELEITRTHTDGSTSRHVLEKQ